MEETELVVAALAESADSVVATASEASTSSAALMPPPATLHLPPEGFGECVAVMLHPDAGPRAKKPKTELSVETHMIAEEAIRIAGEEGLTLVRSCNQSGFAHVHIHLPSKRRPYQLRTSSSRGYFHSAEAAALVYAREIGAAASAAENAKALRFVDSTNQKILVHYPYR